MLGKTDRRRKKGGDCFRFCANKSVNTESPSRFGFKSASDADESCSDTLLSKVEESESEVWIRARSSEALFVISVKSEAPSFNCVKERIQKIRCCLDCLPNFQLIFNSCFIAVFHFRSGSQALFNKSVDFCFKESAF